MQYDLAKRNRLSGKFNFKPRDWMVELDGVEDIQPVATGVKRSSKPQSSDLSKEASPPN